MQLPPGWERCTGADGRVFYVNHNDQTTHWNHPTAGSSAYSLSHPTPESQQSSHPSMPASNPSFSTPNSHQAYQPQQMSQMPQMPQVSPSDMASLMALGYSQQQSNPHMNQQLQMQQLILAQQQQQILAQQQYEIALAGGVPNTAPITPTTTTLNSTTSTKKPAPAPPSRGNSSSSSVEKSESQRTSPVGISVVIKRPIGSGGKTKYVMKVLVNQQEVAEVQGLYTEFWQKLMAPLRVVRTSERFYSLVLSVVRQWRDTIWSDRLM